MVFIYSEKVSLFLLMAIISRPNVVFVITCAGKRLMIFIIPHPALQKNTEVRPLWNTARYYKCAVIQGKTSRLFAPSDNLPHKHTRWNLKISHNFCLFVCLFVCFFQ